VSSHSCGKAAPIKILSLLFLLTPFLPLQAQTRATLLEPATVTIRIDGKIAGKTKLPADTTLEVLRETEKQALLKSRFGEHWINKEKLDIERDTSPPPSPAPPAKSTPTTSPPSKPTTPPAPDLDPLANLGLPGLDTSDPFANDSSHQDSDEPSSSSVNSGGSRISYDSTALSDLDLEDLEEQAKSGNPIAQIELGHRHRRGFGVDKNTTAAAEWYAKASRQGHPGGDMCLARMYLSRLTTQEPASWQNAFQVLDETASRTERGAALHYAGMCHLLGLGTPADPRKAAKLFETFALARDYNPYQRESMWELGQIHLEGKGVPKNKIKAIEWFEKAGLYGHSKSRTLLKSEAQKGDRRAIEAMEKIAANKKQRQ
jgi:TPR repeat protein